MSLDGIPPVIQAWVRQLLSAEMVELVSTHPKGQLDIRLSAAGGKVRSRPAIVLNGGVPTMIDPDEIVGDALTGAGIRA